MFRSSGGGSVVAVSSLGNYRPIQPGRYCTMWRGLCIQWGGGADIFKVREAQHWQVSSPPQAWSAFTLPHTSKQRYVRFTRVNCKKFLLKIQQYIAECMNQRTYIPEFRHFKQLILHE